MQPNLAQRVSLVCFWAYVALFPGSAIVVALNAIPAWGQGMGGLLNALQGIAIAAWMIGLYGRRGAIVTGITFCLAWAAEHIGVTTGFPFGRYYYTPLLAPQLFGIVPLPILLSWLVAAFGSWQLARMTLGEARWGRRWDLPLLLLTATMLLTLDLQIETMATKINPYWVWVDGGPYYDVPVANFVAWWVIGLIMAGFLSAVLPHDSRGGGIAEAGDGPWHTQINRVVQPIVPALLYVLSSIMFVSSNLARGYPLAGVVGIVFLVVTVIVGRRRGASLAALRA